MQEGEYKIRRAVKERYSNLALSSGNEACCSSSCCGETSSVSFVPTEAAQVGAGCGSPVEQSGIEEGMLVVDLGSGGGIDVFRASRLVGSEGKVIGVDSTPEMVWRARETARKYGYTNVEFRLGEIEHLPIESNTVDVGVSNCVINLAPDKESVFREVYRVLKPGGRIVVSDIVTNRELPEQLRRDMAGWSCCISGALEETDYKAVIERSGFIDLKTIQRDIRNESNSADLNSHQLISVTISATKSL